MRKFKIDGERGGSRKEKGTNWYLENLRQLKKRERVNRRTLFILVGEAADELSGYVWVPVIS